MTRGRALIIAGLAVLVAGCNGGSDGSLRPLRTGDESPTFAARSLAGDSIHVPSESGAVLLNVWATWCIPCREEMPALQSLHDSLGVEGLTVVGVSVDGANARGAVQAFLDDFGITFPIVHDPGERVTRAFRTTGVPETFLISEGRVLRRWIGPVSLEDATAAVGDALRR